MVVAPTRNVAPDKLWLPTLGKEIDRPWFLPDEQTLREQHKILTSVFYLVRQGDSFGERLKCSNCGNRHNYITLKCIPRPFTGMLGGLYAYYRLMKDNNLERELSPANKARFNMMQSMLGSLPNIGDMHPELARKLTQDIGLTDAKLGAVSMGILESISGIEARKLTERINDTGLNPKLVLEQPTKLDIYRAVDFGRQQNGPGVHWLR